VDTPRISSASYNEPIRDPIPFSDRSKTSFSVQPSPSPPQVEIISPNLVAEREARAEELTEGTEISVNTELGTGSNPFEEYPRDSIMNPQDDVQYKIQKRFEKHFPSIASEVVVVCTLINFYFINLVG
jgi:hypothetical protein